MHHVLQGQYTCTALCIAPLVSCDPSMKQASKSCLCMMQAELQTALRQKDLYREKYNQPKVHAEAHGLQVEASSSSEVLDERNEHSSTSGSGVAEQQLDNGASSSFEADQHCSNSGTWAAEDQLETSSSSSSEVPEVDGYNSTSGVQSVEYDSHQGAMADPGSSAAHAQVGPTL